MVEKIKEEESSVEQFQKDEKSSSSLQVLVFIFAILLTSTLIGSGTYFWQNKELKKQRTESDKKIVELQKQIADFKKQLSTSTNLSHSEIADWKTYIDSKNGYSIKYPATWVYDNPVNNTIIFRLEAGDRWIFQIGISDTLYGLAENTELKKRGEFIDPSVTISSIAVGGQPATKFFRSQVAIYGDTEVLIVFKGKLFTINFDSESENVEKMLASFKLIP